MTHPERDTELDEWLRRSSSLHEQLARLDRAEPPEELDRVVLDRAREAIRSPRAVAPLRMRWALPVGLAATLIVAFSLLLHVRPAGVTSTSPPARASTEASENDAAAEQRYEAAQDETVARPHVLSQPIEITPSAERSVPPDAGAQAQSVSGVNARMLARERIAPAEPQSGAPAAPRPGTDAARKDAALRDADAWLADIRRLRAEGLLEEAERELAEFRRTYPERSAMPAVTPTPEDRQDRQD